MCVLNVFCDFLLSQFHHYSIFEYLGISNGIFDCLKVNRKVMKTQTIVQHKYLVYIMGCANIVS